MELRIEKNRAAAIGVERINSRLRMWLEIVALSNRNHSQIFKITKLYWSDRFESGGRGGSGRREGQGGLGRGGLQQHPKK